MKSGPLGQNDLRHAIELLGRVESMVRNDQLKIFGERWPEVVGSLSDAQNVLSEVMSATAPQANDRHLSVVKGGKQEPPKSVPSMDPSKVALRVLTALADKETSAPADLEALMRICGEKPHGVGWDELACDTLQRVLRDRAAARRSLFLGAAAAL
jgi:hypothetical protein